MSSTASISTTAVESQAKPIIDDAAPSAYSWYVVGVLMLAYMMSFIDRKLPFILMESIKHDLVLSDTQVGLLAGAMFAVVYATAGIPLAALADRRSRKRLIGFAVLIWGSITALGGLATNFWQLCAARVGVAAGEAACTPSAMSLIGDYFSQKYRARAIGIYHIGSPLGALIGLGLGGLINEMANWRVAMFALGVPGALLALLVLLTVKEPRRKSDPALPAGETAPRIGQALRIFLGEPALLHLVIAMALVGTTMSAFQGFAPSYIIRTYHIGTAELGFTYGLVFGAAGVAGALIGGFAGDKFRAMEPGGAMIFVAISVVLGVAALFVGLVAQNYMLFLACIFVMQVTVLIQSAPAFSTIQRLVGPRMYGFSTSIVLFALSGVGLSAGPLLTGLLSDSLKGLGPNDSLRWALMLLTLPTLWGSVHFVIVARRLRRLAAEGRAS